MEKGIISKRLNPDQRADSMHFVLNFGKNLFCHFTKYFPFGRLAATECSLN